MRHFPYHNAFPEGCKPENPWRRAAPSDRGSKDAGPDPIGVRLCALLGKYVGMKKAVLWGHFMQRQRKVTIWARVQPLPGLKVVSVVPWVTPLATAHSTASA